MLTSLGSVVGATRASTSGTEIAGRTTEADHEHALLSGESCSCNRWACVCSILTRPR